MRWDRVNTQYRFIPSCHSSGVHAHLTYPNEILEQGPLRSHCMELSSMSDDTERVLQAQGCKKKPLCTDLHIRWVVTLNLNMLNKLQITCRCQWADRSSWVDGPIPWASSSRAQPGPGSYPFLLLWPSPSLPVCSGVSSDFSGLRFSPESYKISAIEKINYILLLLFISCNV